MRVSVIIPVYNREAYLADAVMSVIDTAYPDLEIMIVDDGSSDGSWELAQRLKDRHPGTIRCLRHPDGRNHGIAATRNLGIRESAGDIICFLDSDDVYLPNRFERAISYLDSHPGLLGVYEPVIMMVDQINFRTAFNEKLIEIKDYVKLPPAGEFERNDFLKSLLESPYEFGIMPAMTLRRRAFDEAGFFSHDFPVAEDIHLWLRLAATGKIACIQDQEPVAAVRMHEDQSWGPVQRLKRMDVIKIRIYIDAYKQMKDMRQYIAGDSLAMVRKKIDLLIRDYYSPFLKCFGKRDVIQLTFWLLIHWLPYNILRNFRVKPDNYGTKRKDI